MVMDLFPALPLAFCAMTILYLLYLRLLPKPLPGIPYNEAATRSILGDIPALVKTGRPDVHNWIVEQCVAHDSPVIQLFMRPFRRPWIILTDFQEANDILTRRTREFDRSNFFGDLFIAMLPSFQAHMSTGPEWKAHRKLTGDLMASSFLNDTLSERIHEATQDLIELWKGKTRLAKDRPFTAKQDVSCAALDGIWISSFGSKIGVTAAQTAALQSFDQSSHVEDKDSALNFPAASLPPAFHSIIKLTQSIEICTKSPFPRQHHWLALRLDPGLRSARLHKDRLMQERLDAAFDKFSKRPDAGKAKCAIDLLVQRELMLAKKEQRPSSEKVEAIKDELFGFLLAGHDTTATTMCWGLKFLTLNPKAQSQLRAGMKRHFTAASEQRRIPTAQEIAGADIAYLEAVIEEMHRCGRTAPSIIRRATCDTEVLGFRIPKGTDIFMECHGPSYETPAMAIEDRKRSASSRQNKDRPAWAVGDVSQFKPERWLYNDEKGELRFNAKAGPAHPFGGGPRACFGRKLATLQLKIMLALIIWNFELLPTPATLSTLAQHDVLTGEPEQCFLRLGEVAL